MIKTANIQRMSGLMIVIAIVLGFLSANTIYAELYFKVHHLRIHIGIEDFSLSRPLIEWMNEGLMVFFFLLVGLEIKKEILEGQISKPSQIALPAYSAFGGMVLPAVIYAGLNWNDPVALQGWAIPTATDIVLALGILSLLGTRIPSGLTVFLMAVAIFDDIGAVLIIGLFYGEELSALPLFVAIGATALLFLINAYKVTGGWGYLIVGFLLWVALLESGVEASLAGIIIALAVPMKSRLSGDLSPVRLLEKKIQPIVTLAIVPLFAFLNAGIKLIEPISDTLTAPMPLGIILGLVFGKQFGIFGAALIAVGLGLGKLPANVSWGQVYGASLLAGIGFTMSLFVATLAFDEPGFIASAKAAVLTASLLSAVAGLAVLLMTTPRLRPLPTAKPG